MCPLERPVQVLKVARLTHVYIRLQQAHDDRHGCLVTAEAAQPWHHHAVQVQLGRLAWVTQSKENTKTLQNSDAVKYHPSALINAFYYSVINCFSFIFPHAALFTSVATTTAHLWGPQVRLPYKQHHIKIT